MSSWDVSYHRKELEQETGLRWMPISKVPPSQVLGKLQRVRDERDQLLRYERILLRIFSFGLLLLTAGIAYAVYSATVGFDGSVAAAGMIFPGALVAPGCFCGALALQLNVLRPLNRDVAALESAYSSMVLDGAK